MIDNPDVALACQRRTFLSNSFAGIGGLALASLLGGELPAETRGEKRRPEHPWPAAAGFPNFAPKAKRIVHLCMAGGPSHIEALDPKPELDRIDGQPFPESFTAGQQLAQLQNTQLKARKSFCKHLKYGAAGIEMSELFPKTGAWRTNCA